MESKKELKEFTPFSWDKCIQRQEVDKIRRDKSKARHNKSFVARLSIKEARRLHE